MRDMYRNKITAKIMEILSNKKLVESEDDEEFEYDMNDYKHIIKKYKNVDVKTINRNDIKKEIIVDKKFSDKWEPFNGKVYCCTVPTKLGVIYVRNKGCPVWSGNSRSKIVCSYTGSC